MTFAISFDAGAAFIDELSGGIRARRGRINLAGEEDVFVAPVEYWAAARYESQWREGVRRVVDGVRSSCLLTSVLPEGVAEWWPMYRSKSFAIFHNGLVLSSILGHSVDPADPYTSIPERNDHLSPGDHISEWEVPIDDLAAWLKTGEEASTRSSRVGP
jgi:hypothetical protein